MHIDPQHVKVLEYHKSSIMMIGTFVMSHVRDCACLFNDHRTDAAGKHSTLIMCGEAFEFLLLIAVDVWYW